MAEETKTNDHEQLPKPAYRLLKKVSRAVQRFTFLVQMNQRNGLLPAGKTRAL